jgi:large subunit ribosomal protein L6
MSRVGKKPLAIPAGVDIKVDGNVIAVKGSKGQLSITLDPHVKVAVEGTELNVSVKDPEDVKQRALWGLSRRLIENMVIGVTKGYSKQLEINGVGFKVALAGKTLKLDVGFSHDVEYVVPADLTVTVEKNVITVSGIDKQRVGEIAAQIRRIKKPEPYKGKGIKYVDEVIHRKAGKAAKAGSAA